MSTSPTPIGFILTFFAGFCGAVGSRVAGAPISTQAVRSIEGIEIDTDNDLPYLVAVDFVGHRHHVYLDWLSAVRPATTDIVGNLA